MRIRRVLVAVVGLAVAGAVPAAWSGEASGSTGPPRRAESPPPNVGFRLAASGSSSASGAVALQNAFVRVVRQVRPSVVQITTPKGLGSGILFDRRGDIVTNDHVVGSAHTVHVQFFNGSTVSATVVGAFPGDDLAVVRTSRASPKVLHPASLGNSSNLQVGDLVLAIGNPLAYSSSVSNGIISATGRTVTEPQGAPSPGGVITDAIQTSAPINPGNSGGALVDLQGQVVGIPTLAAEDPQIGGPAVGIGFAIPSNTVNDIAGQIIRYGHVVNSHRAALGIYAAQATTFAGQPAGVVVEGLAKSSPAKQAGIRSGDVILSVAGKTTKTTTALEAVLANLQPGQSVKVKYLRGTQTSTVSVKLGSLPGNAS